MKRIATRVIECGVLAVALIAPTQFGFEVWKKTYLSPVDPLIWAVFGLWVLARLAGADAGRVRWPPVWAALFLGAAALSATRAVQRLTAAKDIFQFVEYFGIGFVLFGAAGRSPEGRARLRYAFLASATAVILIGLWQYLHRSRPDFGVGATFGNRNVLGGFLSLALPLFYGLALFDRRPLFRAWYAGVLAAGLLVNLSGGALLALLVSLGAISMSAGRRVFAGFALAAVLFATLVFPLLPRQNGRILQESVSLYRPDGAVSARYPEWQAALVMAQENPWLGVGVGNYQANVGQYFGSVPDAAGTAEPDSQNLYLVLGSSMGWPGLSCFAGLLLWFLAGSARLAERAADARARGLALGLFGALLAFSINAVWSPLLVRGLGLPFVLVCSLVAAESAAEPLSRANG